MSLSMIKLSEISRSRSSGKITADVPLLALPEDGLLKVNDVIEFIRVSKSLWLQWVQKGIAPAPVKIGGNTFWRGRDLRLFIDEVCDANA